MYRLLIVEDKRSQLEACVNRLKYSSANYEIETAIDAEEAIRLLEKKHFDVVITDLKMPTDQYEGFKVIKAVKKKDPRFTRTKVIIRTIVGAANPKEGFEALRSALQLGVSDYILKGWENNLEILDLTIQKILQQQEFSQIKDGQVFIDSPYDPLHDQIYKKLKDEARNKHLSYKFVRADDKYHGDYLKKIIYEQINESEFIVAFISGLNSNVMYELGLAHGMGKKVIIVKDNLTDVVSDLKGIQYLSYDRDAPLDIPDKILQALEDFSPELD